MKKQIVRFLSGLIPAMALFTQLNAQYEKPNFESGTPVFMPEVARGNNPAGNNSHSPHVNARALKDFNSTYKYADNADWLEVKNGSLVKFTNNGVPTRAFYDAKGRLSATIRTYGQDKLAQDIVKRIRSTYYDYSIYLVNEIKVGNTIVYLVSIQDPVSYKTIRLTDEEMEIYEEFEKI